MQTRIDEVKDDYGNLGVKELEKKYCASYSTIQRVLKASGFIKLKTDNVKYVYLNNNLEQFKIDWIENKLSIEELEEKYNCPKSVMHSKARDLNIKRKRIKECIDSESLISDWKSRKYSNDEMCDRYDIGLTTIKKILKENNVKDDYSRNQKYIFDFNYFDNIDNEHKAYWLGFLYADGSNQEERYTVRLALKCEDEYLLQYLYNDIQCDKDVKYFYNKTYNRDYSYATLQNKHFSNTLSKKGVCSNKTFKIRFPRNNIVPNELIPHFIRGYFDGDGSVSINKKNKHKSSIGVVGNYEFIKELNDYVNNNVVGLYKDNITKTSNSEVYYFSRGGNYKLKKFLDYIYKDSSIFMNRKYEKYLEIKDNIYTLKHNGDKIMGIDKMKSLINKLNNASNAYYNSSPIMSDNEWDLIYNQLMELEKKLGIIYPNSPTQNVGYKILDKIEKVKLDHQMLSLDKCHTEKELMDFANDKKCVLSVKCDGLSTTLHYYNGNLISAATRGTGTEGGNVTDNVMTIKNVPKTIPFKDDYIIDGETIIDWDSFSNINDNLPKGQEKYKHPRNLVSGSLNTLDTKIASDRNMRFIAWRVIKGSESKSFYESLKEAEAYGFEIVPIIEYENLINKNHISYLLNVIKDKADENKIPYDGAVMSYDDIEYGNSLGKTNKFFKHSIAYKYEDKLHKTRLTNIEWSTSKTGLINPIAVFEPADLDGATTTRATLHNVTYIKNLQLGIGDEILIYRANMVIPKVYENLTRSNTYEFPTHCPVCGEQTQIIKDNDTEVLVCTNPSCKGKLLGRLSHFVSKKGMNIDGLSEETLKKFIELGWVKNIFDIYYLPEHFNDLSKMDGFGTKSVTKLQDAIEKSKTTDLQHFIAALSIPNIGTSQSKELCKVFKTWNDFSSAGFGNYDFSQLEGFGTVLNSNIHTWFKTMYNEDMIGQLVRNITFTENENSIYTDTLKGKTFVITGSLEHYKNREELKSVIEQNGGKTSGSISKNTFALINNNINSTSSKNKKANSLGVQIISEEDFIQLISK